MKSVLQKFYRFFAGPQFGDRYYRVSQYETVDSVPVVDTEVVRVIGKTDRWIEFERELQNNNPCDRTRHQYDCAVFDHQYTFIGRSANQSSNNS